MFYINTCIIHHTYNFYKIYYKSCTDRQVKVFNSNINNHSSFKNIAIHLGEAVYCSCTVNVHPNDKHHQMMGSSRRECLPPPAHLQQLRKCSLVLWVLRQFVFKSVWALRDFMAGIPWLDPSYWSNVEWAESHLILQKHKFFQENLQAVLLQLSLFF